MTRTFFKSACCVCGRKLEPGFGWHSNAGFDFCIFHAGSTAGECMVLAGIVTFLLGLPAAATGERVGEFIALLFAGLGFLAAFLGVLIWWLERRT